MKSCWLLLAWLLAVRLGAAEVRFTYDADGRLVGADYGGGAAVVYAYDVNGNLLTTSATGPSAGPDAVADVSVVVAYPDAPVVGRPARARATVANAGPGTAHRVVLTLILPANAVLHGTTTSRGFVVSGTPDGPVIVELGSLPAGQEATVELLLEPTRGDGFRLAAAVSSPGDPASANNAGSAEAVPGPGARLALTGFAGPDPLTVGAPLTYEFTVANLGTTPATGVQLVAGYPAGTSPRTSGASAGTTKVEVDRMTADLGTLAAGDRVTVTLSLSVFAPGDLRSRVTVAAREPDPEPADNVLELTTPASASTRVVANANDAGPGSLRQALLDANASPDPDIVVFDIPTDEVPVIVLATPLPKLLHPVRIDGFTQRVGLVALDFLATRDAAGFVVEADGCVFRALVIGNVRFEPAIVFQAGRASVVEGCRIGVGVDGRTPQPNGDAIHVLEGSGAHRIGGPRPWQRNVISGNTFLSAVHLLRSQDNVIQGNYLGLGPDGSTPVPNTGRAIAVEGSTGDFIANNVIAANGSSAIDVEAGGGAVIVGNVLGLDATGRETRTNGGFAVTLQTIGDSRPTGIRIGGRRAGEGNVIAGFEFSAISIATDHVRVEGNLIGTDVTGTRGLRNGFSTFGSPGIAIRGNHHRIGGHEPGAGNLVAAHSRDGILVNGSDVVIRGNRIGTDLAGAVAISNSSSGIQVQGGRGIVIGGSPSGAGNLISGNRLDGVQITGAPRDVRVEGNWIGIDGSGTRAISNRLGVVTFGNATNVVIKGNVISGNQGFGVQISHTNGQPVVIAGNRIGTDPSGLRAISNRLDGILVSRAPNNVIGPGNVLAGNGGSGIDISRPQASGNRVFGNWIGVGPDGVTDVGNRQNGVTLFDTSDNIIGGTGVADGNRIAFNRAHGIQVFRDASTNNSVAARNRLLGNAIVSNGGLGIELGGVPANTEGVGDGPDANDPGDADDGPNFRQNAPVLARARVEAGQLALEGRLESAPGGIHRVEVFENASLDPSGFGEGASFLGAFDVVTDAAGTASFDVRLPAPAPGAMLTATATAPDGSTSEFGAGVTVTREVPLEPPVLGGGEIGAEGLFRVVLVAQPGRKYTVETSFDLVVWETLSTTTATGNQLVLPVGPVAEFPFRFVRVRVE